MTGQLIFDPLVPLALIVVLAGMAVLLAALAWHRGMAGWPFRFGAALVLLGALAGPVWQQAEERALPDVLVMVVDQSSSQTLGDRQRQTAEMVAQLSEELAARDGTVLRRIDVGDGTDDQGTRLVTALRDALADVPPDQLSAGFILSDGRVHDSDLAPLAAGAPLHLLLSGTTNEWDRRLRLEAAPSFAILGEPVRLTLWVEDQGVASSGAHPAMVELSLSVDGEQPFAVEVPVGQRIEVPVTLTHAGRNVIQFSVPTAEGELTDRNNSALVQINGVRDRLRVLLVSGEPHPGARTWRNLLKSDSSVDLVHFTILRPSEKQDGTPVSELSLISFPTYELFQEKIDDFDLIIFDRYKLRGILPTIYLQNVVGYVERGGAVLVAAGPAFATAESIFHSPLGTILPAAPTARVLDQAFRPEVTELGERHPVTAGLAENSATDDAQGAPWGRWLSQVDLVDHSGVVVMRGADEAPLLTLDRVGDGRIALLASDQAWLWDRGFDGGGPQAELLRRLAHWMMKEPELEEEALIATAIGNDMRIERRTLDEDVGELTLITPDGTRQTLPLVQSAAGKFTGGYTGETLGLYRLQQDGLETVIGLGPAAPREFEQTIASALDLQPMIDATGGGVLRMNDGGVRLRDVAPGRPTSGRDWLGLVQRGATETLSLTRLPLLPPWLAAIGVGALILAGWLREGRRR